MAKYFIFGDKKELTKEQIASIRKDSETLLKDGDEIRAENAARQLAEEDNLIHVEGRIVVKLDFENKYSWRFSDGTTIRYERNFNEFNRRKTQPVNCTVISGEGLPKNAELLVDHNAFHETNRINDYKNSFENDNSDRVRYFSVPRYECYAWREGKNKWQPMSPFEFGLRLFKPYEGLIQGMPPEQIKDTLFVTTGELSGQVVRTLVASDYQIIFASDDGREDYLIVFRPFGDPKRHIEEEAICILHSITDKVIDGDILIGYSVSDAKKRIYGE